MVRIIPFAIVALALAISLAAVPASALPKEKDRWIQVDTANFTIFSQASASTAKSVGRNLEQFRAVLARLTTAELNAPIPTHIYVFSSDRAFNPYKPIRDGRPMELGSLFQAREHANYISINGDMNDQAPASIYTMYAFQFLHNNLPGLPLWFNRGMAEYYGTMEIGKKETNVGKPDNNHIRRLRESPFIDLVELFGTRKHPDYRQGELAYRFDAKCWVVVHYLLVPDPERRQQTFEFIGQLLSGVPQDAAFERAFKMTYRDMEKDVTDYVRQLAFRYLRFELAKDTGIEPKVQPMERADVLYRLGDLLTSQAELRPEAMEHFQAALELDPEHALALTGLAAVATRQNRPGAALTHLRSAAELAPEDFLVQYRYGDSLLAGGDGANADEAREALERSVAANPGFAPAWSELAYAYSFDDEPPPRAVVAAETAHRLLPSSKANAGNLLLLYTKTGQREKALALVEGFFVRQGTDEELNQARSQLAYLDLQTAYDLLQENQTEAAIEIHRGLSPLARAGQVSPRVASQVQRLGQDIETQRLGDRYNQAVERYNARDFQSVVELLTEVLQSSGDARLKDQARMLMEAAQKELE